MMNLCLGTVQFGMDYGIFNQKKQESAYCINCLDYATQSGIEAIDTAKAYGIAEEIVGEFLAKRTISREKLFLSTKLKPNILGDVEKDFYADVICQNLQNSLKTLNTDYVDVYFLHSSRYAFYPEILEALQIVKEKGLAKSVGVSVYYPDEAEACFNSGLVEYIQAPYSIFDHRMREQNIFSKAETAKCSIDVRTVFLKGLIHLHQSEVPDHIARARDILDKLDEMCKETGFSRIDLAIGYVKREKAVNHLVFGIRTLEQLKEDIASFQKDIPAEILARIDTEFAGIDANLVIPSLWVR